MARSRRTQTSSPKPAAAGASGQELVCPECGKTFARPAALGAHRRRAHGVAGASARTRSRAAGRGRGRGRRTAVAARPTTPRGRAGLDRDALLQAVFPSGVPAREEVIRAANAWLDETERLTQLS